MRCRHLFLLGLLLLSHAALAEVPRVVVSIPPLHSLVAGVMAGVGEPQLLLKVGASPHHYALKPSDARALQQAALIVWVGEAMEPYLAKPLKSLASDAESLAMVEFAGMHLLAPREGGEWEGHADDDHAPHHDHADEEEGVHADAADPHLWLDPRNAIVLVAAVAERLSALDPENAGRYRRNADEMARRLAALDAELARQLAPLQSSPYLVFHDAYHYFERRYGLNVVGSVTVSPEQRPGARRMQAIRDKLKRLEAQCIFSEPQFPSPILNVLLEGSGARRGELDPLGTSHPPGAEQYFMLMHGLADALQGCLSAQ